MSSGASTVCFHESTLISYKGESFSLKQLKGRLVADCKVPHLVQARGVVIEASCSGTTARAPQSRKTLRLTGDHLVYTARGLQPASELLSGDTIFADLAQETPCRVTRVSQETTDQTYFGLNCVESIVLADGIKTSTFGKYHAIPALWMKYASKLLGIEKASSIGDSFASALLKMKLM